MMFKAPLGEVAYITMGSAPPSSSYNESGQGYPMIAGAGDYGYIHPNPKKWTTEPSRVTQLGDLIVCVRATIGDLNWADKKYCLGRGVAGMRAKEGKLDIRYAAHFIEAKKAALQKLGTGSTFLAIRKADLEELEIPLPPLPEQRRITAILDKADAIRRKRQQAICLTEEFLRSVFLDMFGDPVTNPKGWEVAPLEKFTSMIVDCPHSTPSYAESKTAFPCIRSSDLQDGNLILNGNTKFVDKEGYDERVKRLIPEAGDIIYCREGARLGNLGIVPKDITPCLGQRTMLFRGDSNRATSEFLLLVLNNAGIKKQIQSMVIGAAAPRVNIKDLKNFEVIMPPANLQKVFSKIYGNFVHTKNNQNDFLDKGESLFNSLVQRAFRGDL